MIGDALRFQRRQPKFTILVDGVEIIANDRGNRTTSSLSPSRTPVEFGLAGISCFPRVSRTLQWT